MKLIKITKFRHESGNCWIVDLPAELPPGDREDAPLRSPLRLFEDGEELGPGHAVHAFIREVGKGAYSHWNHHVLLSTSDNSSPRSNGREYVAIAAASATESVLLSEEPQSLGSADSEAQSRFPTNYAWQEVTPEKIRSDAGYALRIARSYVEQLPGGKTFLEKKSVLELGPGWNFATPLILRAWGAQRVAVADRFLVRFQPSYHAPLYREVAALLKAEEQSADTSALERCAELGLHPADIIESLECPIERLSEMGVRPFDIIFSNAVLEHVFDPMRVANSLYALTSQAGLGSHQVDFRDHRDFARPLEYLLLDEFSFMELFHAWHGECGNRLRPRQLHAMFEAAGFSSISFVADIRADESYLTDFLLRLRRARASVFSDTDAALLREISGRFMMRKTLS